MKIKFLTALSFCLLSLFSFSQKTEAGEQIVHPPINEPASAKDLPDEEPNFPGGFNGWRHYFERNSKEFDPKKNGAPHGTYVVIVKFNVSSSGKISDIKAQTNYGYGMEKTVIEVLKGSPDWLPALKNGKPVKAAYKLPVKFFVE